VELGVHVRPFPLNPALHAQAFVPAPVIVQVAFGSQPPLFAAQALIGVHTPPSPL
jgi:hypothetical protein